MFTFPKGKFSNKCSTAGGHARTSTRRIAIVLEYVDAIRRIQCEVEIVVPGEPANNAKHANAMARAARASPGAARSTFDAAGGVDFGSAYESAGSP